MSEKKIDKSENNDVHDAMSDDMGVLIDPDAVFDAEPDIVEVMGMQGESFWELRRGEPFAQFESRVAPHMMRDVVFLWHVLQRVDGSWLEAFALTPRLACLGAAYCTGLLSTISEDDFQDIEYLMPYEELAESISECEKMFAESPFYKRYSEEIAQAFSYIATEFADRGTQWALEVVFDEVRKASLIIKINAEQAHAAFNEMAEKTKEDAPEGTRIIGVAEVDDNWNPNAFIGWKGDFMESSIQKIMRDLFQTSSETDESALPDEDVLSALLLQCYIWSNRSWNKVAEKASDMLYGAMCYTKAMFGPKPKFIHPDVTERRKRLDELAEKLSDGKGGIELQIDESKPPLKSHDENGNEIQQYPLMPESSEFMSLLQEEKIFETYEKEQHVALQYCQSLPACRDNIHSMFATTIFDTLWREVESGKKFEDAFDELVSYLEERLGAMIPAAKSQWKKYFKMHPDVAAAAKRGELIVELYDGDPLFAGDYVPALREEEIETSEGVEE